MPGDRERRTRWASLLGLVLAAEAAEAQEPAPPPAPAPVPVPMPAPGPGPGPVTRPAAVAPPPAPAVAPPPRVGPFRRAARHVGAAAHRDFIGVPELFDEPPLGASLYGTFGVMRARAAGHVFTLYHSDFLVDAATLTPDGAGRLNRICGNLRGWLGPVVVEATPARPDLAEARRATVLALLRRTGQDVGDERVVVGPPVAPGLYGTDAASNYLILINRDQQAATSYSLTPTASALPGGGVR
jgi:hypothetical protein